MGDANVTHEAKTAYVDPGATATDAEDGNLTSSIQLSGAVDVNAGLKRASKASGLLEQRYEAGTAPIGKEQVYYEPEIATEVKSDGTKISKVIVKVYQDRRDKENSGVIPCDTFTDHIYFSVKELYEDFEERGYHPSEDPDGEGEVFGWNLSDSWHEIGSVYIFLLSLFNLIDTPKDESPIIDSKGIKNGMQNYSVQLEILDYDRTTQLNILEYETLRELIGKHLKVKLSLKRATDIPDKYTFKTMAKYEWIDADKTVFET